MGFVFDNENKKESHRLCVFDLKGSKVLTKDFDIGYQEVVFLENDEVCVRADSECVIYTLRGIEKFHGNFKKHIWKIMSAGRTKDYVFWIEGETQKVRLK